MLTCFLGDMSSPAVVNITTIKEDKYCLSFYCIILLLCLSSVFDSSVIIFIIFRPSLTGYSLLLFIIVFTLVVLNSFALFHM